MLEYTGRSIVVPYKSHPDKDYTENQWRPAVGGKDRGKNVLTRLPGDVYDSCTKVTEVTFGPHQPP